MRKIQITKRNIWKILLVTVLFVALSGCGKTESKTEKAEEKIRK